MLLSIVKKSTKKIRVEVLQGKKPCISNNEKKISAKISPHPPLRKKSLFQHKWFFPKEWLLPAALSSNLARLTTSLRRSLWEIIRKSNRVYSLRNPYPTTPFENPKKRLGNWTRQTKQWVLSRFWNQSILKSVIDYKSRVSDCIPSYCLPKVCL